jgi:8-oxo-dGTP pyrophosphatase MutT (NUDIX family)
MSSPVGFDPQSAEIKPRPSEPALPEQALSFSALNELFCRIRGQTDFPVWSPELLRDRRKPVRPVTAATATPASVLIPLVGHQSLDVVLTTRTVGLSSHAGQISFPGGRAEPEDASCAATALREAEEEIGLSPSAVTVLGQLPDYLTATGYRVTPVIGHITVTPQYQPEEREVADIFHVPLSFLMNPDNHQIRVIPADRSQTGEQIQFYAMPYQGFFIWGATAAMLRNLYHLLYAAWRQN